ncbi:MAG: Holliday junction resolvase RuvX [Terriglobia bacterium]
MNTNARVLAIDLGTKNVGLAVSDPLGLTAQGLPTLRRSKRRADLARLRELVEALGVTRVVVGHPLHLKGFAGARAQEAERFARWLAAELDVPVELFDERLTTREAERHLRAAGASRAQRQQMVDQVAATLLLQAYLDRQATLRIPDTET